MYRDKSFFFHGPHPHVTAAVGPPRRTSLGPSKSAPLVPRKLAIDAPRSPPDLRDVKRPKNTHGLEEEENRLHVSSGKPTKNDVPNKASTLFGEEAAALGHYVVTALV